MGFCGAELPDLDGAEGNVVRRSGGERGRVDRGRSERGSVAVFERGRRGQVCESVKNYKGKVVCQLQVRMWTRRERQSKDATYLSFCERPTGGVRPSSPSRSLRSCLVAS